MSLFGDYANGSRVIDVLDGSMEFPPTMSKATKEFLAACKRVPDPSAHLQSPIDIVQHYQSFITSWTKRRDSINTHNLHIGHYKAIIKYSHLSWLFFQRSEIPALTGYSPVQHQRCIDFMIPKKDNWNS